MRIIHFKVLSFCALLAFSMGCCRNTLSDGETVQTVALQKAIELGRDELRRSGYMNSIEQLDVQADDNNSFWKDFIRNQPSIMENDQIKNMKLDERAFWAIYFSPKRKRGTINVGGDAFVFIDRDTEKVIGVLLGE
jgi:hypothetical protein